MDRLAPTIEKYDLGLLAEEGEQDHSRLRKHAFWTVDPLDGTQYFIEGKSGYATSIALVSQAGETILGVVFDPATGGLFEVVKGRGVRLNGAPLETPTPAQSEARTVLFADRSLRNHPKLEELQTQYDVRFIGGAVMNGLGLLKTANSAYIKEPKESLGGLRHMGFGGRGADGERAGRTCPDLWPREAAPQSARECLLQRCGVGVH